MADRNSAATCAGASAVALFGRGYNCAEAIVRVLAPQAPGGAPDPQRAATGFGAGIARRGLTCGCLTGFAIAAGLRLGRTEPDDEQGKERAYSVIDDLMERFAAEFGSIECRTLTGLDFNEPIPQNEKDRVMREVCDRLVRFTAQAGAEALAAADNEEAWPWRSRSTK